MTSLALIFSGLQALTYIEAVHLGFLKPGVVLIGGRWRPDADTYRELQSSSVVQPLRAIRLGKLGRASHLAIGDPYSGLAQTLLLFKNPDQLTILEDGAATYRAIQQFQSGSPLYRAQERRRSRHQLAMLATRRLNKLDDANRLRWVTHRPPHVPVRGSLLHTFEHLRGSAGPDMDPTQRLVVGSALAHDGYIQPERYVGWLERVLTPGADTVFLPHRRESSEAINLAHRRGIRVETSTIPLERRLVQMQSLSEVCTLPTTAALTSSVIRPDIAVRVQPIAVEWWAKGAPDGQRDIVRLVESLASPRDTGEALAQDD